MPVMKGIPPNSPLRNGVLITGRPKQTESSGMNSTSETQKQDSQSVERHPMQPAVDVMEKHLDEKLNSPDPMAPAVKALEVRTIRASL